MEGIFLMRKLVFICLLMASIVTGCSAVNDGRNGEEIKNPQQTGNTKQGIIATHETVSYSASYVRTNEVKEVDTYPNVILLSTVAELQDYLTTHKEIYDIRDLNDGIEKYDETYFSEHILALVVLEEPSGSIRHEVEEVFINDGVLTFQIKRNVPEVGTSDMAQWHIIVEMKKSEVNTTRTAVIIS